MKNFLLKFNLISKRFIIFTLVCCVAMNLFEMYRFSEFNNDTLSLFMIVILLLFINCLYFENYLTTFLLLVFNILFWYYNITERKDLSWYYNPFNHYMDIFKSFGVIGLLNNLLIWIIIPIRIYKFILNKRQNNLNLN